MLTCISILIYLYNTTLPIRQFFIKKWIRRHIADLNFDSDANKFARKIEISIAMP